MLLFIHLNVQVILSKFHNIFNVKYDQRCIEHSLCLNLKPQIIQLMYNIKTDEWINK